LGLCHPRKKERKDEKKSGKIDVDLRQPQVKMKLKKGSTEGGTNWGTEILQQEKIR